MPASDNTLVLDIPSFPPSSGAGLSVMVNGQEFTLGKDVITATGTRTVLSHGDSVQVAPDFGSTGAAVSGAVAEKAETSSGYSFEDTQSLGVPVSLSSHEAAFGG